MVKGRRDYGLGVLSILGVFVTGILAAGTAEETGISIAEVAVFVTDRDGNPVLGLAEKDFEVYEDGRRHEIEVFMPISMKGNAGDTVEHLLTTQTQQAQIPRYEQRRHLFMVFDFILADPAGVHRMLDAASSFVEKELGDRDLVSIWIMSDRLGLQLFSNFTSDRAHLKNCIERLRHGAGLPVVTHAGGVADLIGPGVAPGRVSGLPDEDETVQPDVDADVRARERSRRENWLDALEQLGRSVSGMPGRKFCLFFSPGFSLSGITGTASIPTDSASTASAVGTIEKLLKRSTREPQVLEQIDRVASRFSTAACQVFAFDPTGLYSEPNLGLMDGPSGRSRLFPDSLGSIGLLAYQTGGECYANMNDLRKPISGFVKKTSSYYLLGYRTPARSSSSDQKRFHRVEVRVHRDDVQIRHRPGYAENEEPGANEPERAWIELAATALYDLPADGIRFERAAFTAPAPAGQSAVAVAFEVPGAQFAGWEGNLPLEFYIFALDKQEHVIMYKRGEQVIPELDLHGRIAGTGIRYVDMMLLPSGTEIGLRLVIRNGRDGRIGTATVKVTPASFRTPLFITDPIFPAGSSTADGTTASWLNLRGGAPLKIPGTPGREVADPLFVWNGKQFSPDLNPFRLVGRRAVLVKVYSTRQNVDLEDISIDCELLDSSGVALARPELPSAAPGPEENRPVGGLSLPRYWQIKRGRRRARATSARPGQRGRASAIGIRIGCARGGDSGLAVPGCVYSRGDIPRAPHRNLCRDSSRSGCTRSACHRIAGPEPSPTRCSIHARRFAGCRHRRTGCHP